MMEDSRPSKFTVAVVSSRSVFHLQAHRLGSFYTYNGRRNLEVKFDFGASWLHFPPFPQNNAEFYFFDCTDHNAFTTLNWGAESIRELTLDANKVEQMLNY